MPEETSIPQDDEIIPTPDEPTTEQGPDDIEQEDEEGEDTGPILTEDDEESFDADEEEEADGLPKIGSTRSTELGDATPNQTLGGAA